MKKILIPILIVVLAVSSFAFWYFSIRDDSLNVSTSGIDSSKTTNAIRASDSPEGSWVLQQQSDVFVGYEIKEVFAGQNVTATASAKTHEVSGTLTIAGSKVTESQIVADLTKLESDSSRRDNSQRNQGLQTQEFPKATFILTEPVDVGKIEKNKEVKIDVPGELTLRDVTNEVSIPLIGIWDGKVLKVTGELEISLSDYNIQSPKNSFVSVEDTGKLKLQLLFVPDN